MNSSYTETGPTSPVTPTTQTAPLPAAPALKAPFVPPLLTKQGKVAAITQDFGGSGFGPPVDP